MDHVGFDERSFRSLWVVEIKWSNRYFERPADLLKSLLSFCNANNLSEGVVTTIDKQGVKECQGIILTFIPSAVYAYVVGKNTFIQNGLRFGITSMPRDGQIVKRPDGETDRSEGRTFNEGKSCRESR